MNPKAELKKCIDWYFTQPEVDRYFRGRGLGGRNYCSLFGVQFPQVLHKDVPKPFVTQGRREELIELSLKP